MAMRHALAKDARIVVLGAGFGGLAVASRLAGTGARVTVLDRQNCHVFQPLLYQVAAAALSPADIARPVREILREASNIEVLMDEAVAVDRAGRRVAARHGAYPYDVLVVATGANYTYFGNEKWPGRTLALKSLADAQAIREWVLRAFELAELCQDADDRRRCQTFAIVGGGPTGVEMAGALADLARRTLPGEFRRIDSRQTRIYLFEAGSSLLAGYDAGLQAYARRALERKGITVMLDCAVSQVGHERLSAAGASFEAATILWAAGVQARETVEMLGIDGDTDRVPVAGDCSLPDDPAVFVIGDAALQEQKDGEPLPALAAVAKQQGDYVGDLLRRRLAGEADPEPFRYRDRGQLAAIGRGAAAADLGRWRFTGRFAWLVWWVVHIYMLIGFRNRLAVLVNWLTLSLTNRRASRVIVGRLPVEETRALVEQFAAEDDVDWREDASSETESGMDSFPASDPPAHAGGTAGAPARRSAREPARAAGAPRRRSAR